MKNEFEKAEIEIVRFDQENDVIATSTQLEVIEQGEPSDDF